MCYLCKKSVPSKNVEPNWNTRSKVIYFYNFIFSLSQPYGGVSVKVGDFMSLTPMYDLFLENPCLPEAIRHLPKACVTSVTSVLQVCYEYVMTVLRLYYKCVTRVLQVYSNCATIVL